MSLEHLKTTLKTLDSSTTLTSRRKAVSNLMDILSDKTVTETLNKNHLQKTSITWDYVLKISQAYIIFEADRIIVNEKQDKSQSLATERVILTCCTLAIKVIELSSSSGFLYLTRDSTLECIFQVLDNQKYHKFFLKTYLDILTSMLLQSQHFVYYLNDIEWKEIVRILKSICLRNHEYEIRHISIRSLTHIFELAPSYLLRSWCSVIIKQWEISEDCQQLRRSNDLLKMTQIYCEKMACDIRQSLCKLGEEILPQVLKYTNRREEYGGPKTTVFDFLLLQITLHHPGGSTQDSELAYANDWTKWRSFLGQIYSKICQEIDIYSIILKDNKYVNSQKSEKLIWYNFRRLAVEVLLQREFFLLHRSNSTSDSTEGSLTKRVRHINAIEMIFDEIKPGSAIPWLSILQLYILRHSDKITLSNYTFTLSRLVSMECTIKMERHFQFQCYLALLEIEHCIEYGINKSELNNLWINVWENTIRSFGLNENEDVGVTLVKKLLQTKAVDISLLLSVLKSKKLTIHHLQILNSLYYTNIPSNDKNDLNFRYTLWESILSNFIDTNDIKRKRELFQSNMTAQILVGLNLKQFPLINTHCNQKQDDNYLDNLENVLKKSVFVIDTRNICKLSLEKPKDFHYRVDERYKNDIMEYLIRFYEYFEEINQIRMMSMEFVEKIEITIDILIFSLNILTAYLHFNIIDDVSTFPLMKTIRTFIPILNDNFLHIFEKDSLITSNKKIELVDHLIKLFEIQLHSKFFNEYVLLDIKLFSLLNQLYLLVEDGHGDVLKSQNDGMSTRFLTKFTNSEKLLLENERLLFLSFKALCNYIFKPNFNNTTSVQGKLLKTILDNFLPDLNFKNAIDLKIGFMFCSTIANSSNSICYELLVNVFNILDNILKANEHYYVVVLQVIEVFREILKHVAKSNNSELEGIAHKFLYSLYSTEKHGQKIFKIILLTIKDTVMINPHFNWVNDDDKFTCWEKIVSYSHCHYHDVRLLSVDIMYDIFNLTDINIDLKKTFFSDIDSNIKKVLKVNDSETDEYCLEDEKTFRVCSLLYTYAIIGCSDSRILPECLFSIICYAVKINTAQVQLSLKYILHKKKEENLKNLFASHLEYLIIKWCNSKNNFDKFPYQLFGYNTNLDFIAENLSLIIPLFLKKNSNDSVKTICVKLNINLEDTIKELFAELFVEILPIIACKTPLTNVDESIRTELRHLKINLYEILTKHYRIELIQTKIQDILFNLIKKFDDRIYFQNKFNIVMPSNILQNNRLFFSYNILNECIEYLENEYNDSYDSFILMFAQNSPQFFQKCLLELSKLIYKSTNQNEQLLAFQQYIFFCEWTENYFHSSNLKPVLQFIVRDIITNILNIVTNSNNCDELRLATCKYFIKFCDTRFQSEKDIFKEYCHIIINSISPLTKKNTNVHLLAILFELLKIFLVDNKESITESITELEPFPNVDDNFRMLNEIYDEVRYKTNNQQNLEDEIKVFLKIENFENVSRLESLKRLYRLLERQKDELFQIYNQLKIQQGSFEMCRSSILHNLIISLIELSYSSDEEVKLMSAKCLGELGPSDLRTLILKVDSTKLINSLDIDISLITAGVVIQSLSNFIVDKDWDIRKMASEALYAVLSSPEGYHLIHDTLANIFDVIDPINLQHIYPYVQRDLNYEISEEFLFCISNELFNNLQDSDLWCPLYNTQEGHELWLINLIRNILKSIVRPHYIKSIISLCEKKINFAEKFLPILIEMLLCKITNKSQIEIINNKIALFFHNVYNHYRVHHRSLKIMLDVINLNKLRSHRDHTSDDKSFLKINYLHVAKAAYDCSSFFTAVFYAELWCRQKLQNTQRKNDSRRLNIIEYICQNYPDEGEIMQKILRKSYTNIDDPDAVHGCGISHLYNMEDRVEHYSRMGRWDQTVLYNDFMLSSTSVSSSFIENAYRLSLKNAGLYNTANIYAKTVDYECLWRMQNWNQVIKNDDENFEKYHYLALKSVYDQESNYNNLRITRKLILKSLQYNLETTKNLYSGLSRLQLLQEIEDFSNDYLFNNLDEIISKWQKQSQMESKDFHYLEPIYNQRITLLEIAFNKTKNINIQNNLINFQINLAEIARKQKWFQVARMALLKLKHLNNIENVQKYRIRLEEAQLEWDLGLDKNIGRSLLQNLLPSDFDGDKLLRSKAYRLYGTWMMETKSENPNIYFEEALNTLDRFNLHGIEENENRYSSYAALAKFADNEHQQVKKYLNSQAFEIKQSCITKAKEICANYEEKYTNKKEAPSIDERRMYITNKKNCQIDEADLENTRQIFKNNLLIAAKYYLLCLIECENYNLSIFRLISLWLENRNHEELNDLIEEKLQLIPTYKFLLVLPQIAPHITNSPGDRFAEHVNNIIEQCAIDHPHHVLSIVLALANAAKDNDYLLNKGQQKQKTIELHPRVLQAQYIIKKLSRHQKIRKIVISMDTISDALIKLAYEKIGKVTSIQEIPSKQPILKLRNLDHVHIHTLDLPVQPSKNYENIIIGIYKWENIWSTPGGINEPKKVVCVGSDGISRNQLVKGKDDLRQDAVMQQVFSILNTLLISSNLRHLTIRTYKVVPLSRKSGILEWCDNTQPLSSYLLGSRGAHSRYHPEDYAYTKCVEMHKTAGSMDNERKLQVFNDICAHFQPTLHYFFFEKFGSTAAFWWERRRAYTLSVASTSMIGYILGLGDRHLSNILIDTSTAEVIHIDFGIAFDQAQVLPTPETVPFRLSRDIEDGMGISGVEGVFRRSSEKTMSVLRQNSEIILTILQVLLYDPLYMWNISVSTAMKIQARGERQTFNSTTQVVEDIEVNKMAERALLRLTQKLQGIENGRITSVEGQVEQLIQEARNPANLCRLWVGWSPFA